MANIDPLELYHEALARLFRVHQALSDLYEAEGHVVEGPDRCRFTGCTCGAVERRAEARARAAKALRP